MVTKKQGAADDNLSTLAITDFSGGLNTMDGPLSLASNQTPSCQNCFGVPGRLQYCGGFAQTCTLPYAADAAWEFYDVNDNRHEMVWANGNLYDCAGTSYSLIASGVYVAGQQVGRQDLGGILYYTTATVPLRQYNGTTEKAVGSSGLAGSVPPPAGTYLTGYAGSLIMANPTIATSYAFTVSGVVVTPTAGATYTNNGATFTVLGASIVAGSGNILASGTGAPSASGTLTKTGGTGDASITFSVSITSTGVSEPGSFIYCNVNDPTSWIASNINQLGSNEFIQWIVALGVSAAGVPPTGSFMIGCTNQIFLYQGPLDALTQKIVNTPVGALDPNSAVFIPSKDLFPGVIFIGSDTQFWMTNGITSECVSLKIQNLVYSTITNARQQNINQTFHAAYDAQYHYYVCDVGNNSQFAYRWNDRGWYTFSGWPSGAYITGHDPTGFTTIFCAANSSTIANAFYELGVASTTFGGAQPVIFYTTPYMHGGDSELQKDFQWIALDTLNNYAGYTVVATSLPNSQNFVQVSNTLTFNDPTPSLASSGQAQWDVSLWDQANWAGFPTTLIGPAINHGMFSVPVPASTWVPANTTQPLRSGAITVKISWLANNISPTFDITGIRLRFNPRGRKTVGGQQYTAESGTPTFTDPFVN